MSIIAPSFLASDWKNVESEIKDVVSAGADWIHLDVMDGQFVPQITFGPQLVKAVKDSCNIPLDVHLMIENPENQIEAFAKAGADVITVHYEATKHVHHLVRGIKALGVKAGVAINPGTPVNVFDAIIDDLDLALIMTVNPGWGGQKFIHSCLDKIADLKKMSAVNNPDLAIQVDGGVNAETGAKVVEAGANVLVAGTYVFRSKDRKKAISSLKNIDCKSC